MLSYAAVCATTDTVKNIPFSSKNSISVHLTYNAFLGLQSPFSVFKTLGGLHIADQFGFYYSRQLDKDWSLKIGYAFWNTIPGLADMMYGKGNVAEVAVGNKFEPGAVLYYSRYKMIDLAIAYPLSSGDKHRFIVGAGPSYSWGKNTTIDSVFPGIPEEFILYTSKKNARYWGGQVFATYEHKLYKDVVTCGSLLRYRKYTGYAYQLLDLDLFFALNF